MAPKGECVAENRAFLSTEPDLACSNWSLPLGSRRVKKSERSQQEVHLT